jgi:hypothetical protein
MSFLDRINSIESRMAGLEAKIDGRAGGGAQQVSSTPMRTNTDAKATAGPSFESILNTVQSGQKFNGPNSAGAIGTWNGDSKNFDGMIKEAASKHGVDESLVRAVIKQESAFNPKATSGCGAKGLMQLMDDTAKDLGVTNSYDPYQNIMGGAKYLRQLLDRFDGNMTKAIAGYNAGPGAVEKFGGIPPYNETQDYVTKVMANFQGYKSNGAH